MDENLINEYRQSGWSEEDIDLLRGIDSMADTINMIPDDMDEFAKEYSKKVSNGTKEGFEAILRSAEDDPEFFKQLMAINIAMTLDYDDSPETIEAEEKVIENMSKEDYEKAKTNFFSTMLNLPESDKEQFIKMVANLTPEQKEDMIERLLSK